MWLSICQTPSQPPIATNLCDESSKSMTNSGQPHLGNTSTDIIASLAKGVGGAIPLVGAMVSEIIGNVIPNQRVDRIVEFVRLLEKRVIVLEQGVLKDKFSEPAIVDLLEDAFIQAARATSHERLEHIANVVANGMTADELKVAEVKRMIWLLGQLNDSEIIILRGRIVRTNEDFRTDRDFRERHSELLAPDMVVMGSTVDEIEKSELNLSFQQHLFDLGLLRHSYRFPRKGELPEFDNKTGKVKSSGADLTRLGLMLLKHLDLIPEWYSSK